jgi:NAD(P)-dependent dehydrogenase (short-subunit alcohol dehydrogenase family)
MGKPDFGIEGRIAVVTGGAQGLGFAMAGALAASGANVVIADLQEEKARQASLQLAAEHKNRTMAVPLDVSRRSSVEAAAESVLKEFGRIDILVNNAGVLVQKSIDATRDEDWDFLMDINLKGVFRCSQVFGRSMVASRRGKIINISSVVGFLGAEDRILYGTSKSGVAHMTKLFAREWAKFNINANCIAPGYLLSEMTAAHFSDPVKGKQFLGAVPLGRYGDPQDVGGAVVFLASGAADYITGQVLFVDGGRMLV